MHDLHIFHKIFDKEDGNKTKYENFRGNIFPIYKY